MSSTTDRNLLSGMLALQMGFVSRDELIGAMQAWTLERTKSVGEILLERGALSAERLALIEPLLDEHVRLHDGDSKQSLAAVGATTTIRHELEALGDALLSASLSGSPSEPQEAGAIEATIAIPPPETNSARFRVLRPHAQGGLGEISVARDAELNREIALKKIHARLAGDPTSRLRFAQEAEITGRLEHPGVVPVYGLGQSADGCLYYAMKFIRGETLKHAIERFHATSYGDTDSPAADTPLCTPPATAPDTTRLSRHSLEFRELLGRFVQVCNTVGYAHSRGVLHRDLKPSNIMLGSFGETLLVDWGLAKALGTKERPPAPDTHGESWITPAPSSGSVKTMAGSAVGTPAFMSPEQAGGRLHALGPASDVYGLGATLYCLLVGKPPLAGDSLGETLRRVERGEFPLPRMVRPAIPPALEAICLKAMAQNPRDRYTAAQSMAADLEHWLADEPVSAWREPASARLARWARRHRSLVASAAMLFVVGTISAAVAAVLVTREQSRTSRAQARAKASATLADAQARTAGAMSSFLIGMFEEPTPYKIYGMRFGRRKLDPAAQVLLDRGARQLAERLDDQPLLKAATLAAIGRAYLGTGALDKAAPLLEQGLDIHRRELPRGEQQIADDLESLTQVYLFQDRPSESERCAREALRIRRATLDESDETVVNAKVALALVLVLTERQLGEVDQLWREVLEARQKSLDADDPRIAEAMIGLGGVYLLRDDLYRPIDAVPLMTEALRILGAHEETRDLGLGITATQGAILLERLGNSRPAAAAYQQALQRFQSALGDDHPITSFALHDYAQTLFDSDRREDARAAFDEIFANYQRQGFTFTQRDELADTLDRFTTLVIESGEPEKLEQILRGLLAKQKSRNGYRSWNASTLLSRLVATLKEQGRSDEAQVLVDDYLATTDLPNNTELLFGAEHFNSVVDTLLACGRVADAARTAQRYAARLRKIPREAEDLSLVLLRLGQLHHQQQQLADADRTLAEADKLARQVARGESKHFHPLLDVSAAWAETLLARDKPDQAERVLRQAVDVSREITGEEFENDHRILEAMLRRGDLLLRNEQHDKAKAQFETIVAAAESADHLDEAARDSILASAQRRLADLERGPDSGQSKR